jgi:hypothetical protein
VILVAEIAAIILQGGILLAPTVSVGPIHRAVGPVRWGCYQDPGGVELLGWQAVPYLNERGEQDSDAEDDPSPFGAAYLFVALVGEDAAGEALAAYRERYEST